MITFKTPLTYKYYFLANFYRLYGSIVNKLIVVLFIFIFVISLWFKNYNEAIFAISMLFAFYIVVPLIKLAYAKLYFKMDHIEYYFDESKFGYTIGDYKFEMKKEKIEYMAVKSNYIFIKIPKLKLYFVANKNEITKIAKKLLASKYKTLFNKSKN